MNILILGGTVFLGPFLVQLALERGHRVTLFHRGNHPSKFHQKVETLHGDRQGDLELLKDRSFDAVIDTSGQSLEMIQKSVAALGSHTSHYVFVSSISAYQDFVRPKTDETFPTSGIGLEASKKPLDYGAMKSMGEKEVLKGFPNQALIIRPGLIVGPNDPTDRFTYWIRRIAKGGRVLLPGLPQRKVQWIDVRDLAAWILDGVERKIVGIFNATGPGEELSFGDWISRISTVSHSKFDPVWISDSFLLKEGVKEWTDLPLWLSESNSQYQYMMHVDSTKAIAQGLKFRPIEDTIRDTLDWDQSRPKGDLLKAGISDEYEEKLLLFVQFRG